MISIVTSVFNAKLDFEQFVRQLHATSQAGSFEVLVLHDDRVEDGSTAALAALSVEFPAVKVAKTQTKATALTRIRSTLASWEGKMDARILSAMVKEADEYEQSKWDATQVYLWLSPLPLLNEVVEGASGDLVLIAPCDRLAGFRMEDLETWAAPKVVGGKFYTRLPLLPLSVSNGEAAKVSERWAKLTKVPGVRQVPPGVEGMLTGVRDARQLRPSTGRGGVRAFSGFPSVTALGIRRYDLFSKALADYRAVDPRSGAHVLLSDPDWVIKVRAIAESAETSRTSPISMAHHGLHLFTPGTWTAGGGYPTDLLGRTVADDVLCKRLQSQFKEQAPAQFSFVEPRRHGIPRDPALRQRCLEVDSDALKHPIPWSCVERQLVSTMFIPRLIKFERALYEV